MKRIDLNRMIVEIHENTIHYVKKDDTLHKHTHTKKNLKLNIYIFLPLSFVILTHFSYRHPPHKMLKARAMIVVF